MSCEVHGVDAKGEAVIARKLRRAGLLGFFGKLAPCEVAMEACSSSHHWARQLMALGHKVKLIPAAHVKPYVRRNKNDAADAAAICEATMRPGQRFVPVRTIENQAELMRHRIRDQLSGQRVALMNALRGHLVGDVFRADLGRDRPGPSRVRVVDGRDLGARNVASEYAGVVGAHDADADEADPDGHGVLAKILDRF
jgi:transposase